MAIPDTLRQRVFTRANYRCEYCRTREVLVISLEVDHIIPTARGGETTFENLCACCRTCNGFKNAFVMGKDPETMDLTTLFHPRTHIWSEHFEWSADGVTLLGRTPTGRATIARLQLNNRQIQATRRLWIQLGLHPPTD